MNVFKKTLKSDNPDIRNITNNLIIKWKKITKKDQKEKDSKNSKLTEKIFDKKEEEINVIFNF